MKHGRTDRRPLDQAVQVVSPLAGFASSWVPGGVASIPSIALQIGAMQRQCIYGEEAEHGSNGHMMCGNINRGPQRSIDVPFERVSYVVKLARVHEGDLIVFDANDCLGEVGCGTRASEQDPSARELRCAIGALSKDEQAVLVALVWIGRGDFGPDEFDHALTNAFDRRGEAAADYLLSVHGLSRALENGVTACCANAMEAGGSQGRSRIGRLH